MRQRTWLAIVLEYAVACRIRMILSVFFALLSVAASLLPFLAVYRIIAAFMAESATAAFVLTWCLAAAAGHLARTAFYGVSTTLSHQSAYRILEGLRNGITERLVRAPLGTVLGKPIGELKNTIVDRVETIELPLAHVIPEGTSYGAFPVVIFVFLCLLDWRLALASIATIPLTILLSARMMGGLNEKYDAYVEANNRVSSVMVEYVEGIEVVKAFNQTSASYEKFKNAVGSFFDYTMDWFRSTWALMNLIGAVAP